MSDERNANPTPEALLAMHMWGQEYSEQKGGSMDFWDKLSNHRKNICKRGIKRISEAMELHKCARKER